MRLATLTTPAGERLHVRGRSGFVDVATGTGRADLATMTGLLAAGPAGMDLVRPLTAQDGVEFGPEAFRAAVPAPPRVLCVGLNYAEHALEGGREVPSWPESFVRGSGSVIGPYDDLVRPALASDFDYEAELGVVIGTGGRYLTAERALEAVAGYVVLNECTAREWQRAARQWTPGKNFEGTLPVGPELVTADEIDVSDLAISSTLNGTVMQSARTSQMLIDVAGCIEFFSSFTTLRPGDIIASGTPGGVGFARTPPVWMHPGDVIEVAIEAIPGTRNRVVAEQGAPASWRWRPTPAASGVL